MSNQTVRGSVRGSIVQTKQQKTARNDRVVDMSSYNQIVLAIKKGGDYDNVKELMKGNEEFVNKTDINNSSLMHHCAWHNRIEVLELLVDEMGANVNIKNTKGNTALHMACEKGRTHVPMCEMLIKLNANVNVQNVQGNTPMHLACQVGNTHIQELLVKAGGDYEKKNNAGKTCYELSEFYISQMKNCEATVYTEAQHKKASYLQGLTRGKLKRANMLLGYMAGGLQPQNLLLHTSQIVKACKAGDVRYMHEILETCSETERITILNAKDKNGSTVIYHAIWPGHLQIVEALLLFGADVNTVNNKQNTPLHLASTRGWTLICELLVQKGANTEHKNIKGKKPRDVETSYKDEQTTLAEAPTVLQRKTVRKQRNKDDAKKATKHRREILKAVSWGKADKLLELLEEDVKNNKGRITIEDLVNKGDMNGSQLVHHAVWPGQLGIVELLLEKKADINAVNTKKNTPLHFAYEKNHVEIIKFLEDKGANQDLVNNKNLKPRELRHNSSMGGCTSLSRHAEKQTEFDGFGKSNCVLAVAVRKGNLDTLKFLINDHAGGDEKKEEELANVLNAKSKSSLLFDGAWHNRFNALEFLLQCKANVNHQNLKGNTALHMASAKGYTNCIELLHRHGADGSLKNCRNETPIDVVSYTEEKEQVDINVLHTAPEFTFLNVPTLKAELEKEDEATEFMWDQDFADLLLKHGMSQKDCQNYLKGYERLNKFVNPTRAGELIPLDFIEEYNRMMMYRIIQGSARTTFQTLDKNNDKTLCKSELTQALVGVMGGPSAAAQVDMLWKLLDKDDSGEIDQRELMHWYSTEEDFIRHRQLDIAEAHRKKRLALLGACTKINKDLFHEYSHKKGARAPPASIVLGETFVEKGDAPYWSMLITSKSTKLPAGEMISAVSLQKHLFISYKLAQEDAKTGKTKYMLIDYTPATRTWKVLDTKLNPIMLGNVGVDLYCLGGKTLRSVRKYTLHNDKFVELKPMPVDRVCRKAFEDIKLCAHNNDLYVMGGHIKGEKVDIENKCLRFETGEGTWREFVQEDGIIVSGNIDSFFSWGEFLFVRHTMEDGKSEMFVMDDQGSWTDIPDTERETNCWTAAPQGQIVIIGMDWEAHIVSDDKIYKYNKTDSKWQVVASRLGTRTSTLPIAF